MQKVMFKKVGQFEYSSEANIFKGKLEAENIEVFTRDNHSIEVHPLISSAIGGIKLLVMEKDYEKAINVLSEISDYSLDARGELMKCPNCKAEKIQFFTTVRDFKALLSFAFSLFFALTLPIYVKYKYKCSVCTCEFEDSKS